MDQNFQWIQLIQTMNSVACAPMFPHYRHSDALYRAWLIKVWKKSVQNTSKL